MTRVNPFAMLLRAWLIVAMVVSSIGILGCASIKKAGKEPANPELLKHSNFWNFYRRGIARMNAGRWADAAEDMERCLGLRAGAKFAYPLDRWRVRTYGLHVSEHYFPHREWGVCLLELGRAEEAVDALLTSLRQQPSARARHYLNRARAMLVRDVSLPPPTIVVQGGDVIYSRQNLVGIEGRAQGDAYVSQLLINGKEQFIELAENDLPFRHNVLLPAGVHDVPVEALDLRGVSAIRNVRIIVDPVTPQFQFARARREGNAWRFEGVCVDTFGLRTITRDGAFVLPAGSPETIQVPLNILLPDGDDSTLLATDWAGNTLQISLRGDVLPRLLAVHGHHIHQNVWADAGAAPATPPAAAPSPVRLSLDSLYSVNITYDDLFFISGSADATSGLTSLEIQGEEMLAKADTQNNLTRFGFFVPVPMGESELNVLARARDGTSERAIIRMERRKPAFAAPALRLAASLPPLLNSELLDTLLPAQESLLTCFVDRAPPFEPRFQILARGDDLLAVLEELKLNLSDLVDDRARVPYRRLATTDLFLNGEVLKDPGGLTVRLHTVATETGQWLGADDVYIPASNPQPAVALQGLAAKAERRFPVVQGQLEAARSTSIDLPVGTDHGVREGASLLVIRPGEDGGVNSGQLIQAEGEPAVLVVTRSESSRATARFAGKKPPQPLQPGDWFYSR